MKEQKLRIVRQWANYTLYHFGGIIYELVPSGKLTGQMIIASDDDDALEQCAQLCRKRGTKNDQD